MYINASSNEHFNIVSTSTQSWYTTNSRQRFVLLFYDILSIQKCVDFVLTIKLFSTVQTN